MNLVDEEDVALFEVGELRGEVASLGDHRSRRCTEIDAELARNDLSERGLAEPRRPDEQDVVERVLARFCRLDKDFEVLARRLLAGEIGKRLRLASIGRQGLPVSVPKTPVTLLVSLNDLRGGGLVDPLE